MADRAELERCFRAFAQGDYAATARQATELVADGATLQLLQVWIISLQRLGADELLQRLSPQVLAATEQYPWDNTLLRLTLGQALSSEALDLADDDEKRCQAHYYAAMRLAGERRSAEAVQHLKACLRLDSTCLERQLAEAEATRSTETSQGTAEDVESRDPTTRALGLLDQCFTSLLQGDLGTTFRLGKELGIAMAENLQLRRLIDHATWQLILMAHQRTGDSKSLQAVSQMALAQFTKRPWELMLLRLTLGEVDANKVLADARDDTQLVQAHYYVGARHLAQGREEAARAELVASLRQSSDCFEHHFARETLKSLDASNASQARRIDLLTRRFDELHRQQRFVEAVDIASQLLSLTAAEFGENSERHANAVTRLAGLYYALERFDESRTLFEKAAQISAAVIGEDHPQYAAALTGVALLRKVFGDFAEAESIYRRVLQILGNACGESHPLYATALFNLAECHRAKQEYTAAEPLLLRALDISAHAVGDSHPDTLSTLAVLAEVTAQLGRSAEAETLRKRLGAMMQKSRP